jgi:hypothetical protein
MSVHERRRGIAPLRIIEKLDAGDAHTGTLLHGSTRSLTLRALRSARGVLLKRGLCR